MRALVANDDRFVRRLVDYLLQKHGAHEVVHATNSDEALQRWTQGNFDLVIIDWQMPDHSGLQMVRSIRADGSRAPILMITDPTQHGQILEAIETGVSDYLLKPVDFDTLRDKLRGFCEHIDSLKLLKERTGGSTRVEYLNPFIASIIDTFDTMLHVNITRLTPFFGRNTLPDNDVSGIISLTGKACGVAVVSLGRETALRCAEQLLGERPAAVDCNVIDAVGELANIVAGGAKAQMQQLNLNLSLPSIIIGKNHVIGFPSDLTPICVPFQCDWGPVSLQVGLKEQDEEPGKGEELATVECPAP